MFCFCCGRILLASAYYKNLDSRARLVKKTRYPAVKNSWIINTIDIHKNDHWNLPRVFQHFDLWSEIPSEFLQCFGFAQIVRTLCDLQARFSKTTYPVVRNSSRFSTKISIWICWDVGVEIPSDFRTSGLNNCLGKVVQKATKRLNVVRQREIWILTSGVTLQLRDKGCTWCWFSHLKEIGVGSEAKFSVL